MMNRFRDQNRRPNPPDAVGRTGFTLVELMTATAVMGVIVSMVWGGLVSLMETNQTKTTELNRKHELNRAADFLADDIRAGTTVSIDVTMPGPNQGLFEVRNEDGAPIVAYYVAPKGSSSWKGPYVLKRKEIGMNKTQALVDGISDSLSLECLSDVGVTKRKAGVRVTIQNQKHLKICLVGHLGNNNLLSVVRQANVRN